MNERLLAIGNDACGLALPTRRISAAADRISRRSMRRNASLPSVAVAAVDLNCSTGW